MKCPPGKPDVHSMIEDNILLFSAIGVMSGSIWLIVDGLMHACLPDLWQ